MKQAAPMVPRARPNASALALAALLGLFAARFTAFLSGGTLYFRDAGFFFTPWRALLPRLWSEGFPAWNDWLSNGRAFAADPNAAVFWPLSPLLFVASPTVLALANLALLVLLFWVALRVLGLSPGAASAGASVLLFSGVFQTLPVFIGVPAAAAPVALAIVAFGRIGFGLDARPLRGAVVGGAALALSFLGGEPVITATGGAAAAGVALAGVLWSRLPARESARRLGAAAAGVLLALGLSAVQLLPTLDGLRRSARGTEMAAEHGALFWSVRPTRLLTVLEPKLTGDPFSETDAGYWGAGTFDAGNPYFYDLALGLVPLALVGAALGDRRGRAALAIAAAAVVLSFGRFLPGYGLVAERLAIFRYPEKWWLLATLGAAAAAAVGVDRIFAGDPRDRALALRSFGRTRRGARRGGRTPRSARAPLAGDAPRASLVPPARRGRDPGGRRCCRSSPGASLWHGLAARRPGRLGARPPRSAAGTAPRRRARGRLSRRCRGARGGKLPGRSRGSLHGGDARRRRRTRRGGIRPFLRRRRRRSGHARCGERATPAGLDRLRPATGTLFGIRYALENDIDRMTPRASVQAYFDAARLPWGEAKTARLRAAGVSVARTAAPPPDPPGVEEIRRDGEDRIVKIEPTRPEFLLVPEAILVPDGGAAASRMADASYQPMRSSVVEVPGADPGSRTAGRGVVTVRARSSAAASLDVLAAEPGGTLVIGRTFDRNWKATLDGHPLPLYRADGFLTAAFLPSGRHAVELRYENPLFALGAALSLLASAVAALLLVGGAAR